MFRNYLKIAWRNLVKNRAYAFINVAGLGLGIGCALLIFALVRYHYQIDRHHHNYDRIYQFTSKFMSPEGGFSTRGIPYSFGKALRNDHPDIEHVAMLDEWYEPMVLVPVANGPGKKIKDTEHAGAFVEPAFFQIFDYTWLAGGPDDLKQPGTVVLSADRARTYFGTISNVLGRTIRLDARTPARVVGIFADYKDNTDLAYSVMASWSTLKDKLGTSPEDEPFDNTNGSTHCFATFNSHYTAANWNRQMPAFVKKNNPGNVKKTGYPALPFSAMHLSTNFDFGGVSRGLLLSLCAIGFLLIGTASINFVNLATAQALNRAREVGVRKVLGSTQSQLFWQLMGETALITLAATALAIGLFQYGQTLAQTYLNGAFWFRFYFSPPVVGWLLLLIVGVTLLSGLYPALVLAGFRPVVALAGRLTTRQAGGISIRRGLVVTQFAISQVLIIGLVVVASQLRYVRDKDLGFRKDAILTIALPDLPSQDITRLNTFRNLAAALPDVDKLSYSMGGPPQSGWRSHTTVRFDTRTEEETFGPQQTFIDADYAGLYGLKLVAGRHLQRSDTAREALLNETFVRRLGLKPTDVVGKLLYKRGFAPLEVVGVLKDYNQSDLKERIDPLFLTTFASGYHSANVQLRSTNYQRAIRQLEAAYSRVYPDSFFATQFVDDQIERSYQQEQTMGHLINFFAGVALLIGCMGLYGLVLFMVVQKTKEIGVRKVLGAGVGNILWLFSQEFAQLILLAFVLAVPLAWWVMNGWLSSFQYKITLGPGIFLVALLVTILVAALTVSFQSLKAALMNPVKALRSE